MPSAAALRLQIEAALASRIPSALTPAPRIIRPVAATGVSEIDALLDGLPLGAITEMVGPECSGRTSVALSFVARMTQAAKVCAWVDVSNALHPESAAAAGVDLTRLLWIRCGVQKPAAPAAQNRFVIPKKCLIPPPAVKGLHGGGYGPHPRNEIKGLSDAVSSFLRPEAFEPGCAEPQRHTYSEIQPQKIQPQKENFAPSSQLSLKQNKTPHSKPWSRIEQALRVTDLLLQAGGFSAIVLDMGSIAPEHASRVPLATWFRYRAAAERTQASIILLAQHPCAKSSGELLLRFQPGNELSPESTVFTGIEHRMEVTRRRFPQTPDKVVPLRKPPQSANTASWQSRTAWTGWTGAR
ncbi:MAG: recombinase RecA [Acidobacteriaceae bacterium]